MKIKFDINEIERQILESQLVKGTVDWAKGNSFPGFKRVPIYDVLIFIYNEITRFDLFTRANSIAFSFFFALFPALIVLFTLVPFLSEYILSFFDLTTEDFLLTIRNQISNVLPGEDGIGDELYGTIEDFATKPRSGMLSFGFALAMFFASNGMVSMMRS